jgi:hypothetical protein
MPAVEVEVEERTSSAVKPTFGIRQTWFKKQLKVDKGGGC